MDTSSPISLALLSGGLVVSYGLYSIFVRPRFGPLAAVPGPESPHWLLGLYARGQDQRFCKDMASWHNAYGSTYVVDAAFGSKAIVTRDQRAIHHATAGRPYVWGRSPIITRLLRNALGRGLLTAEGAAHRRERRVLSPAFAEANMRALPPIFRALAYTLVEEWSALMDAVGEGSTEVDAYDWLNRYAFDAIGLGAFGHDFHCVRPDASGEDRLAQAMHRIFRATVGGAPIALAEAAFPVLKSLPTERRRIVNADEAYIYNTITVMVQERKAQLGHNVSKGDIKGTDILSLLVKANVSSDIKAEDRLTDENVAEQVALFMSAGHETVTGVMSLALWTLTNCPRVQDALRAELLTCPQLATDSLADECTYAVISGLPYLDAVTKEMYRMWPAGPNGIIREALEDDIVPLETPVTLKNGRVVEELQVRKGDTFYIAGRNRDTSLWGDDAEECRPERWLEPELAVKLAGVPGWNHLTNFGYGTKNCIGSRFAVLEFKVCIASLVREFVFSAGPRTADVEARSLMVTKPYLKGDISGPKLPVLVSRFQG